MHPFILLNEPASKANSQFEDFRWRGEDVSRIEALSDAVFAFAVTLLVVSLEVPKTFRELQDVLAHGILAFAISFALLMQVWRWHYTFFRRYGLQDSYTLLLNIVLLFVILFYIYPLKFLFLLLSNQLFGVDTGSLIQDVQWPFLMVIYGLGFLAVQCVFVLLYLHAYRKRVELVLTPNEVYLTWTSLLSYLLLASLGLFSILIAVLSPLEYISWSGYVYLLIAPFQVLLHFFLRRRYEKRVLSSERVSAP